MNQVLNDELKHKEGNLDDISEMTTHNDHRKNQRDDDKSLFNLEESCVENVIDMAQDMKKDDDNFFHIPEYSKPITFVNGGFLDDANKKIELEHNDHEQVQDDAIEDDNDGDNDAYKVDEVDDDDAVKIDEYDDSDANVDTSIV